MEIQKKMILTFNKGGSQSYPGRLSRGNDEWREIGERGLSQVQMEFQVCRNIFLSWFFAFKKQNETKKQTLAHGLCWHLKIFQLVKSINIYIHVYFLPLMIYLENLPYEVFT